MLIIMGPAVLAGAAALLVHAGRSRSRPLVARATGVAAAVSLAVTVARPAGTAGLGPGTAGTLEALALLALLVPTARHAALPQAIVAGTLAHLAVTLWVLRAWNTDSVRGTVGACVFWSLLATGAAAGGAYLRMLDTRRVASVADARRRQRLYLARDLHDFVAHDVSEMVAQAQTGRFLGAADPGVALDALRRIEEAGLRALAAMDRTVHMLHGPDGPDADPRHSPGGLDELPELVGRFRESSAGRTELALAPGLFDQVSREVSSTAYRIVVEALTNVRRHAPDTDVTVTLDRSAARLTVEVGNGAPAGRAQQRGERAGGLGLPGLAERVTALGGSLTAGPRPDGGWLLAAELPLAGGPDGSRSALPVPFRNGKAEPR
ncbi:sensor histidine kinase [Kitasatospora sp. NPDC088134]|uniref:sensor histidine kinase n=1 Tax=Kitasatospora sp. NPDC088134 TaxID=3364071 RepID=UPI00382A6A28